MDSPSATLTGPTRFGSDILLSSEYSPLATPLNITGTRQNKESKPTTEASSKSPPGSSKVQHVPCKFFRNGACTAGKNCIFSHSKEIQPSNIICKYYAKGNCKFGNKCALQHGNEKKPTRNNSKPKSQNSHIGERLRQPLEQRSLAGFGDEVDFLSRSFSRTNLDPDYASYGGTLNNANYYTPQLKISQLSNIFTSPNPSRFSSSLPSQKKFSFTEEKLSGTLPDATENSINLSSRLRKTDFPSNFSFGFSDEHDLLPSSLDELLTPTELQMRRTKASILSRPGFMNRSNTLETFGASPITSRFKSEFDNGFFGSSLPSGSSLGITEPFSRFEDGTPIAPSNSLLTHSFNSDGLFLMDRHLQEEKEDANLSETSESKRGDDKSSISNGLDDDVPFPMEGDF